MQILFSDEKLFDTDDVYKVQNDHVWAPSRHRSIRQDSSKKIILQGRPTRDFSGHCDVGLLVVPKRIKVVESRRKGSFHKRSWFGSAHAWEVSTPLVAFEEGTRDYDRYTKEVFPMALRYSNKIFSKYCIFQQDGTRPHVHHLTQKWCRNHFLSSTEKDYWPSNHPDLNLWDYCIWNKLVKGMKWAQVLTKQDLTDELLHATKKVRLEVVFATCTSWTRHLWQISHNDGNHLDKWKCHFYTEFNSASLKRLFGSMW